MDRHLVKLFATALLPAGHLLARVEKFDLSPHEDLRVLIEIPISDLKENTEKYIGPNGRSAEPITWAVAKKTIGEETFFVIPPEVLANTESRVHIGEIFAGPDTSDPVVRNLVFPFRDSYEPYIPPPQTETIPPDVDNGPDTSGDEPDEATKTEPPVPEPPLPQTRPPPRTPRPVGVILLSLIAMLAIAAGGAYYAHLIGLMTLPFLETSAKRQLEWRLAGNEGTFLPVAALGLEGANCEPVSIGLQPVFGRLSQDGQTLTYEKRDRARTGAEDTVSYRLKCPGKHVTGLIRITFTDDRALEVPTKTIRVSIGTPFNIRPGQLDLPGEQAGKDWRWAGFQTDNDKLSAAVPLASGRSAYIVLYVGSEQQARYRLKNSAGESATGLLIVKPKP